MFYPGFTLLFISLIGLPRLPQGEASPQELYGSQNTALAPESDTQSSKELFNSENLSEQAWADRGKLTIILQQLNQSASDHLKSDNGSRRE